MKYEQNMIVLGLKATGLGSAVDVLRPSQDVMRSTDFHSLRVDERDSAESLLVF